MPVFRQLTGDGLTPVSAFRPDRAGRPFVPVRERDRRREGRSLQLPRHRADPDLRGAGLGGGRRRPARPEAARRFQSSDPFRDLEALLAQYRAVHLPGLPRFAGGAVGYAAYDAVRYTEHLPDAPPDDRGLPDLSFAFYDRMVLFDHIRKTILVVAHAHVGPGRRPARGLRARRVPGSTSWSRGWASPTPELGLSDIDTEEPIAVVPGVEFHAVPNTRRSSGIARSTSRRETSSRSFRVSDSQVETSAEPFNIYRVLRVVNPSPFLFYLPFGDFCLIGSSPEILVRVEDGMVTIRPLAGTRRRGRDEAEDRALAAELLADPKERAEHIMLVDLGRNDVGRVADFSSVQLSDVMKVERYSHVMHITSNVTGRLSAGKTAFDALRAGLPAGTVSGAPKVRAMQIIDEVEPQKRGPYAGAVGYIDFTGNMDTCIALRTLVLQGKKAYVQAGGGVVFDSDPSAEYEETVNKAKGILKAIQIAEKQL